MNLLRRKLFVLVLALACFWLTARTALAQTLTVVEPDNSTVSGRLSDKHGNNGVKGATEIPKHPLPPKAQAHKKNGNGDDDDGDIGPGPGDAGPDAPVQTEQGPLISGTGVSDFDGLNAYQGGYIPSDSNIAVSANYIMETVNAAFAVYDKSGTLLYGPNSLESLWSGLGGSCGSNNGGDTVVQYDLAADRWIMTQLGSLSKPYSECIAVSTSSDPTGSYYLYSYSFGSNLNDYPKFGVWPTATNSAYLATFNLFANGSSFLGPEICAYDRAAMLAGAASPVALCYTGLSGDSFLPSDVDGPTPPLDGTPGYFVNLATTGSLGVYTLKPNFTAKTATLSPFTSIGVGSFSEAPDAKQPGTTQTLDALSDRLMYRLAFRVFSDHEAMVVNHAVTAGSSSGERWYELRAPVSTSGTFSLFQQGTYAPDSSYRWMGSAAMDQSGDIGLGYSVSSSTTYPAVRYTGRVPGDAAGTMESEASIKEGAGSQTGYNRWGDYSSMRIDPSDDCTFWYVNEYLPVSSSYGWYTHIGSFHFFGCGLPPAPDFSLSANPTTVTVTQGNPGSSTITVQSLNGFNSAVGLAVSGCPSNATCAMSVTPVTPPTNGSTTSTLNITTNSTTPAGTATLTITGTGSSGTHTTTVSLTVNAATTADFSLSASPTAVALTQGNSGSSTITVHSLNGFKTAVGLAVTGCPANATCAMSPTSVTPRANGSATSKLNITTTSTTPPGTVTLTITGTGSSGTHTTTVSLTVNPGPGDFSISTSSGSLTVSRNSSGSVSVNTAAMGAGSSVTLSVSGLPSKTTGAFSPNPITAGGNSTLTLSVNSKTKTGTYTVTVTGNNGPHSHSTTFSLTVN